MRHPRYRAIYRFAAVLLLWSLAGAAVSAPVVASLYRDPNCGCCHKYVEHLRTAGFDVEVQAMGDRVARFRDNGVAPQLSSCHLMRIDDYVVVGHVPLEVITRLLSERPLIRGVSLPGMPIGSPGMPGPKTEPFVIRSLAGDVYARL